MNNLYHQIRVQLNCYLSSNYSLIKKTLDINFEVKSVSNLESNRFLIQFPYIIQITLHIYFTEKKKKKNEVVFHNSCF